MTTIGFIGLGIMGRPMAANLVKAGYSVVGYSRRSEPAAELVRQGGRSAGSISAVTAESDVLITMLPDSPDVEDVVLGEQGVLAHARPGLLLIDMSTIRPQSAMAIAEAARAVGVRASDVDTQAAVAVLAGGLGGNRVLELKAAGMLGRQFAPGFRIDLHHKDLGIVLATAREAGVALPVTGLVAQLFVAARAQGLGSFDHTGLMKVIEGLSAAATN